jgi:energy-coupling factor transporter ATP-binding protein EcfA2
MLDGRSSGIDRNRLDEVWKFLIDLSREQGITIFILTTLINEGSRYEHISSIDSGRVLPPDAATNLVQAGESTTLEDVFIRLEEVPADPSSAPGEPSPMVEQAPAAVPKKIPFQWFSLCQMRHAIMSLGVVCRSAETARRALVVMLEQFRQLTWFKRSGHEQGLPGGSAHQQTVKEMPMKKKLTCVCRKLRPF